MALEHITPSLSTSIMSGKGLTRLCEPLATGWVAMPLFITVETVGFPVISISLFQVARDEHILLGWRASDTALPKNSKVELALLSQSFGDIAARDDMQAFVVWKGEDPVLQIDVVGANNVLAEIPQAPADSYLLYLKAPFQAAHDQLIGPLRHSITYFFTFEEVQHLYTIVSPEDIEWRKTMEAAGLTIHMGMPIKDRIVYTIQKSRFLN